MPAARILTEAAENLRTSLPAGADPSATIRLAGQVAFLIRDRDRQEILPGLLATVQADPQLAAGLIVALGAMVDVDSRPSELLAWLGNPRPRRPKRWPRIGAAVPVNPTVIRSRCGNRYGYGVHRKAGEKPCAACQTAQHEYDLKRYDERLAKQGKTRVGRGRRGTGRARPHLVAA